MSEVSLDFFLKIYKNINEIQCFVLEKPGVGPVSITTVITVLVRGKVVPGIH
jgi:hypothetical protein